MRTFCITVVNTFTTVMPFQQSCPGQLQLNSSARSASSKLCTCSQSSRVGTRNNACQPAEPCGPLRIRCSAGSTYASVLPVPVRACATRSLPDNASGMHAACTGVGMEKPFFLRACNSFGSSWSSSNVDDILANLPACAQSFQTFKPWQLNPTFWKAGFTTWLQSFK